MSNVLVHCRSKEIFLICIDTADSVEKSTNELANKKNQIKQKNYTNRTKEQQT